MKRELDATDNAILEALKADSRLSVRRLSETVHRSPTAVFERLRRLEDDGIIRGYTVKIDDEKLGRGFTVFCNVKLRCPTCRLTVLSSPSASAISISWRR